MKRLLLVFLAAVSFKLGAQEFFEPFHFYVFSFDEAVTLFQHQEQFAEFEENGEDYKDAIEYYIENGIRNGSVAGLFMQSFFRETSNEFVRNTVLEYLENTEDDEIAKSIRLRYGSTFEEIEGGSGNRTFRFNYQNKLFDENILYSRIQQRNLFEESLSIYLPHSDWGEIVRRSMEDNSIVETPDTTGFMTGGNTSSCYVKINREHITSVPNEDSLILNGPWSFVLPTTGVIGNNGAEITTLEILGWSDDYMTFQLTLYDGDELAKYTLEYYIDISRGNINYEIFDILQRQLIYFSFLTHLNEKQ